MAEKRFTQAELNRVVASRLKRERERLTKQFENKLKRCMASVHMTLYQEMCTLKWELSAEPKGEFLSELAELPSNQSQQSQTAGEQAHKGT